MMEFTIRRLFLVNVFLVLIAHSLSRSTEKQKESEEEVEIQLIVKRDAPLDSQEVPFVQGRAINPNSDMDTPQSDSPQSSLHEGFETSQTIYQPEVNNDVDSDSSTGIVHEVQEEDEDVTPHSPTRSQSDPRGYSAQYPYQQATSSDSSQSGTHQYTSSGASGVGGYHPSGSETMTTRRRVQTYGSSPDTDSGYHRNSQVVAYGRGGGSSGNPGYETRSQTRLVAYGGGGGSSSDPPSQTQSQTRLVAYGGGGSSTSDPDYQTQSQRHTVAYGGSSSNYPGSGYQTQSLRRVVAYGGVGVENQYSATGSERSYLGGTSSRSSTSSQYGGSNTRYQNGRYYDSAGHLVDQYGRHIDSSGRLLGFASSSENCCDGSSSQGIPSTYNPIASYISDNPNCPSSGARVRINGLTCNDAISQLGHFVCYNYERVSPECCERCLQVKNPSQIGCEYGDRSYQCRNIQPFDCYVERNRQICCEQCRVFREQRALTGSVDPNCEYGDLTPRCLSVRQRAHLCYLPENQRLCCDTCRILENDEENSCEYGDAPVQFSTGLEILDCGEYIRQYGVQTCHDHEIATKCCYTCHRYTTSGRG